MKIALVLLFCVVLAHTQTRHAPKAPTPEISATFSKAAVKALVTIQGTDDERLVDAAMIEERAEQSGINEQLVGFNIELFKVAKHQGRKLIELGADPGVDTEENESKCVAAWLPNLRALSKAMPKECDILWAKPQSNESKSAK
ncbi:MAG: hypothetical protein WBM24_20715 [Candidatus Sulfotelmatobacter sp.]